jgi:hyperosmotically inducible periplasmic protein
MSRSFAILLTLSFTVAVAFAQDGPGPIRRAGQALDRAGKNIRYRVETEVARGQEAVQDREVLHRVARRIEWDKQFLGSTMRIEVQPGGRVILQGSVLTEAVKLRAVDVVGNTIGVTGVVDELAVVKDVKVIKAKPAGPVIESKPSATPKTEVDVEP